MDPDLDFVASCLDEIALEGLDGITLSALWLRLTRRPMFPFPVDEEVKPFIWETLSTHTDLEFFLLPEPRPPLTIFNRYNHIDIEMGIIAEPDIVPEDIYPIQYIKDGNIQGSCFTYKTRVNITDQVRDATGKPLISFEDSVKIWGEKLVLVASQLKRTQALVGKDFDPTLELSEVQYVMLERIGRSRYHGEVTQGKCSLAVLGVAPKTLHYQRKRLLAKQLVTKQIHYQRTPTGQMTSGMLLHLTRFYVEKRPKCLLMWEQLCHVLSNKSDRQAPISNLRVQLGMKENSFKKMFHKYLNFMTVVSLPLREANPGLPEQQYFHINGKEKMVKGLRLNDDVDISKIGKDDEEDEEAGDDEDEEEEDEGSLVTANSHWPICVDRPLVNQVVELLEEIGPDGASVVELSRCLGLPKLEMRLLCRNLERHRVVSTIMKDVGRQRVSRFVFRKFEKVSELHQQFLEERRKLLEKGEEKAEARDTNALPCAKKEPVESLGLPISEVAETSDKDQDVDVKPSTSKFITSFKEDIKMWDKGGIVAEKTHLTYRLLRRANLIVETVRQEKLVDDVFKLQKMITEIEAKEGYSRIDKKSVLRLIHKLGRDGYLRSFKTVLRHGNKVKKLHLICAPDVCETDAIVRSAVDQAKFKHFFTTGPDSKSKASKDTKDNLPTSIHASLNALEKFHRVNPKTHLEFMPNIGRLYGICPKFVRMKNLHEFVYYLVYQYEGDAESGEVLQLWEDIVEDPSKTSEIRNEDCSTPTRVPKIYHPASSWKRHVPPLPIHQGWPRGWFLMSDVLLRIPLCIFVTMVNFNHKVEGLEQYLRDPNKRLYLIAHLPQSMLNGLLYGRRYIFSIVLVAQHLANVGLLSFGPHQYKEKDQKFMYLHRKASLMDTTTSKRSYFQTSTDQEYPTKMYELCSLQDVEKYWFDLRQICLHTQLGCVNSSQGEAIVLERLDKKPAMVATCRPKELDEIVDDGTIPGDIRGAAGLDSALFAHLKRNWSWMNTAKNTPEYWDKLEKQRAAITPGSVAEMENDGADSLSYLKYLQQEEHLKPAGKRLSRLTKNKKLQLPLTNPQAGLSSGNEVIPRVSMQPNLQNRQRMRGQKRKPRTTAAAGKKAKVSCSQAKDKIVRVVKLKKKWRIRQPYYDDVDRAALLRQRKLRVDWTPQEDTLLLLCKVASTLLHPNYYQLLVMSCITVRDLLHKFVPESNNKTSRACQRRILYMMRNPQTAYNVAVFVGEAQQDENLMDGMVLPYPPLSDPEKRDQVIYELLERLVKKFKNAPSVSRVVQLPLSVDSLHVKYSVTATEKIMSTQSGVLEVKNVVDIHFSVVSALVLSSLCCTGDRTSWSFQLFRIYQQYPDSLLRSVFARLRNEKLISKKKGTGRHIQRILPISTLPFQLSITFEYKFLSRYQQEIYGQANNMLKKLLESRAQMHVPGGDNHGIDVEAEKEMGVVATVVALMAMRTLVFDLAVPDQAVVFDPACYANEQGDVAFKAQLQHWEEECAKPPSPKRQRVEADVPQMPDVAIANLDCEMYQGVDSLEMLELGGMSNVAVEVSLPMTSSTVKIPAPNRASRVALYLLRQQMIENPSEKAQRSQDYFVVNSCGIQCRLRPVPWISAHPPRQMSPSQTVPPPSQDHDYTSAGEDSPRPSSEGVNVLLAKETLQDAIRTQTTFIDDSGLSFEAILQNCLERKFSTEDTEDLKCVYNFVVSNKDIGTTLTDLQMKTSLRGTKSLLDLVLVLTQNQLVFRVGVSVVRYVAAMHARPWILHSVHVPREQRGLQWEAFKEERLRQMAHKTQPVHDLQVEPSLSRQSSLEIPAASSSSASPVVMTADPSAIGGEVTCQSTSHSDGSGEEKASKILPVSGIALRRRSRHSTEKLNLHCDRVRFICRPWRKPDGKLNRPVLRTMLSSILSYVMVHPGVPFLHVTTKFLPALQPVYTLELVEILETIQCLRKICIKVPKPSLFGTLQPPSIENPPIVDPFTDQVCLEAEIDCVLRLGQMMES